MHKIYTYGLMNKVNIHLTTTKVKNRTVNYFSLQRLPMPLGDQPLNSYLCMILVHDR